jgi:hypothetical protein
MGGAGFEEPGKNRGEGRVLAVKLVGARFDVESSPARLLAISPHPHERTGTGKGETRGVPMHAARRWGRQTRYIFVGRFS